jgi:hypothetical protein
MSRRPSTGGLGHLPSSASRFRWSHHWRVPIVRNATPDDAENIGEAHAEAWRIAYELFPRAR